jgi:hypothetical protein
MAPQSVVNLGLLIVDVSGSHSDTTTLGRTPLDEWSARRRDLYLTTHNTHKRQTSMPPTAFEPAIPASERPQIQDPGSIRLFKYLRKSQWFLQHYSKSHYSNKTKFRASFSFAAINVIPLSFVCSRRSKIFRKYLHKVQKEIHTTGLCNWYCLYTNIDCDVTTHNSAVTLFINVLPNSLLIFIWTSNVWSNVVLISFLNYLWVE